MSAAYPTVLRPEWSIPSSQSLDEIAFGDDDLFPVGPATGLARPSAADSVVLPSGPSWRVPVQSWPWIAWLAGAMIVLSSPIAGRLALRRWTRQAGAIDAAEWTALLGDLAARLGLSRRIRLLRGTRAAMPMTWGWLRPVVLLPADADAWDEHRRRDVLLHELAHVKRLDCLTQAIARYACAVYWFHPLAWVAARRMRVERERACDDVVLLSGARASDYAGHLLEIARRLQAPRAAALAGLAIARASQLEGRLRAILDPSGRRGHPGRRAVAIAMLAAILLLLPLAMVRLGAGVPAMPVRQPTALDRPPADPAGRMMITGRVLDPQGKPVPHAAVMVLARSKLSDQPTLFSSTGTTTAFERRCDSSGRFRVELPRTSSARHDALTVTALAPGYGLGWAELDPDAESPTADVALRPEQVIRGRLYNLEGQPARGVRIAIQSATQVVRAELAAVARLDLVGHPLLDSPAWPASGLSDDEGRFTFRGLGRGLIYSLITEDPRFSRQVARIRTDDGAALQRRLSRLSAPRLKSSPDWTRSRSRSPSSPPGSSPGA